MIAGEEKCTHELDDPLFLIEWMLDVACQKGPMPSGKSEQSRTHHLNLLSIGQHSILFTNRLKSLIDLIFGQGLEGRIRPFLSI